jgi:hypothetical protein
MSEKVKKKRLIPALLLAAAAIAGASLGILSARQKTSASELSEMSQTAYYPAKHFKGRSSSLVIRRGNSTSNDTYNYYGGKVCREDSKTHALIPPADSRYKYQIRWVHGQSSSSPSSGDIVSSSNSAFARTISTLATSSLKSVWNGTANTKYYYYNLAAHEPTVTYNNCLIYDSSAKKFVAIDVKLHVDGYGLAKKHAYTTKGHKTNPYIAIGQKINGLPSITILNVASVRITYSFFKHGTSTPYSIKTSFTYADIDRRQAISVDTSSGRGFMIPTRGKTDLYFGEYKGFYATSSNYWKEANGPGTAGFYDTMMGYMIGGKSSTFVYTSDQMPVFAWNGLMRGQNNNTSAIAPPNGTHSYFGTSVIRNKVVPDMGGFSKTVSDASGTAYAGTQTGVGTDAKRDNDGDGTTDSSTVAEESAAANGSSDIGVTHNRMPAEGTESKKDSDLMYYVLQQVVPPNMSTSSQDAQFAKNGLTFTDNIDSCLTYAGDKKVQIYTVNADPGSSDREKMNVKNIFSYGCDKNGETIGTVGNKVA